MTALATIERRLDRHAIDQLRAEVVRLSGMVEALTAALDDAEVRARWAEDNSNFWEGIAEIERAGNTVGLTQSGEVVALPLTPGLNIGAILRADARDNIPKLEVLHGEELENSEADGSEAGGEARTLDAANAAGDCELGDCADCGKPVTPLMASEMIQLENALRVQC